MPLFLLKASWFMVFGVVKGPDEESGRMSGGFSAIADPNFFGTVTLNNITFTSPLQETPKRCLLVLYPQRLIFKVPPWPILHQMFREFKDIHLLQIKNQ